ncbi:hypothetical protein PENNAL_c0001G04155 [Penicillium nalgiovense]|uniref:DNA2/NAM7 helicase helicase domain-containing protein n=1 Tax=Penicillium nalgiovense TaxID=60175 RepID=A0A1V6Z909_PENNA|nr:hypothetical protein PENNAL_c0001G04155 [Penicillium nalgiovense]
MVTKRAGRALKNLLYARWIRNQDAEVYSDLLPTHCRDIWKLDPKIREEKDRSWKKALLGEQAESLSVSISLFDKCQNRLSAILREKNREILKSKQIIGCTTTAAAIYSEDFRHASPGIVLLEEAGENLESHVLTAMTPETKHLILIGDHQQLRPNINSYNLSVEKGDGYDLNPRGLCEGDIFHHQNPEDVFGEVSDRRDTNSKGSKRNVFEADIVLKIVKYLGRQGYGTDKLVVLTSFWVS